jgi:hypothetical protein
MEYMQHTFKIVTLLVSCEYTANLIKVVLKKVNAQKSKTLTVKLKKQTGIDNGKYFENWRQFSEI